MASDSLGVIVLQKIVEQDLNLGAGRDDVVHPGGGTQRGDKINLGTFGIAAEMPWAPVSVPTNQFASQVVPCVGARVGYMAKVSFTGTFGHHNRNLTAEVVASNEVLVIVTNNDPINPLTIGSGTLRVLAFEIPL